ncbi:hypothetical protein BDF14DRAFT_1800222 [Spinellus fusiger]|nr:hypothetical protein BDF14DRAFT_1800222 [Spinellus fusiger]
MTIFHKLSGLAQKAKDNATLKTILLKDKRLENSLSESVDLHQIALTKMSTYGLSDTISTIAYDSVASLLAIAVGSKHHSIRVFGRGISATVTLSGASAVKYMQFKIGQSVLIVIDRENNIHLVDLKTRQTHYVVKAEGLITSFDYCVGSEWLFLGYADGHVGVLDLHSATFSTYQIPDLWKQSTVISSALSSSSSLGPAPTSPPDQDRFNHVVVALQMHPTDYDLLLIGYPSTVYLWSIRDKAVKRVFKHSAHGHLTCFYWSPEGDKWIGGYDDGYLHMWDIRADGPLFSRKAFEANMPNSVCEPVYALVWHKTDHLKTNILVAGGSEMPGLFGLHLLEFESGGKDCRKQTILPSSVDISTFILMPKDPYFLGAHQPLGVLVLGCDGTLRAHGLEHGFPLLTLPPALTFLDPPVAHIHFTLLGAIAFESLMAPSSPTEYLPLAGGTVGSDHTHRIQSNDILLTWHLDGTVSIYDASYTALRPLSYLSLNCRKDTEDPSAHIQCAHINRSNGSLVVGFDNGTILLYRVSEAPLPEHDVLANCDSTLKEISELLQDMDVLPDEDMSPEAHNNEFSETTHFPIEITSIKQEMPLTTAYVLSTLIRSPNTCIKHLVSAGQNIIAFSTTDSKIGLIDISASCVLFTSDMQEYIIKDIHSKKGTEYSPTANEASSIITVSVTYLGFFYSYSPSNLLEPTLQLYVGLSNGSAYHYAVIAGPSDRTWVPVVTHVGHHPTIDLFVVDLKGHLKTTNAYAEPASPTINTTASTTMSDVESVSDPTLAPCSSSIHQAKSIRSERSEPISLLRKSSRKSNKHGQMSETAPPVPKLLGGSSVETRPEYRYQTDPHFVVLVTTTTLTVSLSGFHVKLFQSTIEELDGWQEGDWIIRGQVVQLQEGTCISVLLTSGRLVLFSLPNLRPLVRLEPPVHFIADRLKEATLTPDGRVLFWTGQYELEQYAYMLQNGISFNESVMLYNPELKLLSRPVLVQQAKKTWLGAVAGAFQKDALTIDEFNSLMGYCETASTAKSVQSNSKEKSKEKPKPKGVFEELGDKMNERGERLNQLDQKFQDMSDASGDFLKAVREYNERQSKKKWWEF